MVVHKEKISTSCVLPNSSISDCVCLAPQWVDRRHKFKLGKLVVNFRHISSLYVWTHFHTDNAIGMLALVGVACEEIAPLSAWQFKLWLRSKLGNSEFRAVAPWSSHWAVPNIISLHGSDRFPIAKDVCSWWILKSGVHWALLSIIDGLINCHFSLVRNLNFLIIKGERNTVFNLWIMLTIQCDPFLILEYS